ncbi:trichohyalin-like isoform X2 [Montipora capricornis]|uniref:trichohyalin-like isoform X2 n=1 Tax=Montipora capricornis TaxID=246305 RepID=UPI0035F17778
MYGNGQEDQIIFLAPATQKNPVFVERMEGAELQDFDTSRLYERVRVMVQGLSLERDQLTRTRQLRQDQEKELHEALQCDIINIHEQAKHQNEAEQPEDKSEAEQAKDQNEAEQAKDQNEDQPEDKSEAAEDKSEADMIRERRSKRLRKEPVCGISIIICLNNGSRLTRSFDKGALFQEVYDWAGSLQDTPLYFTLHRGGKLVHHKEEVEGSSVLHLTERGKEEAAALLASEVSFKGDYTPEEDLSATVNDDFQKNRMTTEQAKETEDVQEVTNRNDNEEEGKKKRKKKDKRSNRKRKKQKHET